MADRATTIEEQIALLESRGVKIDDKEKAKENLLDIGYYRLSFYWFPFEKTYPRKIGRTHDFKEGTESMRSAVYEIIVRMVKYCLT